MMILRANVLDLSHADTSAICDAMICDPPYSAHVHAKATSSRTGGAGPLARDLGFAHLSDALREWIAVASGSVRRWSVVCTDFEGVHEWRNDVATWAAATEWIRLVPWVRWSQPQISGDRPPTGAEAIMHFHAKRAGKKHWNGPGGLTHYRRR